MNNTLTSSLRQPLVHFLIVGAALFGLYQQVAPQGQDDPRLIRIERDNLLNYMQFQAKAFNPELFNEKLDGLGDEERQRTIDGLVREEALYREALALDLDQNDYVIRRRLIQKLEFITQGITNNTLALDDNEISEYFHGHRDEFYVEPYVTFTHVFFDKRKHGQGTLAKATEVLEDLNREAVSFSGALAFGDRFPYHRNYVERVPDYLESHFGSEMTAAILELRAGDTWQGPFISTYGAHLVLVADAQPGRYPELSEVIGRVREEAQIARAKAATEAALDGVVASYRIEVAADVENNTSSPQPAVVSDAVTASVNSGQGSAEHGSLGP